MPLVEAMEAGHGCGYAEMTQKPSGVARIFSRYEIHVPEHLLGPQSHIVEVPNRGTDDEEMPQLGGRGRFV